jgi:Flp pilus assembly protein TadB
MLQSSLGLMMIGIAVVMMVMGALWLRKTVQIEV